MQSIEAQDREAGEQRVLHYIRDMVHTQREVKQGRQGCGQKYLPKRQVDQKREKEDAEFQVGQPDNGWRPQIQGERRVGNTQMHGQGKKRRTGEREVEVGEKGVTQGLGLDIRRG